MLESDNCENCKKPIEFVGLIWIPKYGPLKDFKLRFDTTDCVKAYHDKYSDYMEERGGWESQNTNIKED